MMWIFSDLRLRRATMSHKGKKKTLKRGLFLLVETHKKIRKIFFADSIKTQKNGLRNQIFRQNLKPK